MKLALFNTLFFILLALITVPHSQSATNLEYIYDENGNLIQGDGKFFEYNDANRLARVRQKDENGPVVAEFVYDHAGQRVKKIENGVVTYYIGKRHIEELRGESADQTNYYFANGQRVAKKEDSDNLFFFHIDHLGGTNSISDYSGASVDRASYFPFGGMRDTGKERFSFNGKEKDESTSIYFFESRFYWYKIAHFSQPDTIYPNLYEPASLNRYAFVKNNPVKFADPTGKVWFMFVDPKGNAREQIKETLQSAKNKAKEKAKDAYSYVKQKIENTKEHVKREVKKNADNVIWAIDQSLEASSIAGNSYLEDVPNDDYCGPCENPELSAKIPDKILDVDLKRPCYIHDKLYGTAGMPKSLADFTFLVSIGVTNMGNIDKATVTSGLLYYGAVSFYGDEAYQSAQRSAYSEMVFGD